MSTALDAVLVVVEGEAASPFWMDHWGEQPCGEWTMLEQEPSESAVAFGERMEIAVRRHAPDGNCQPTVVLVTSTAEDALSVSVRYQLCATVLNHMSHLGGGRLVLTRGYGHDGREEPELGALAEELAEEWAWSGVEVEVKLDSAPPVSQVRSWPIPAMPSTASYGA